jgi:hypothetical protein
MDSITPSSLFLKELPIRTLRVYEGVWLELRRKKVLTIDVIDPGFVPRINRMLSKEKNADVGFALLNEDIPVRIRYSWNEKKKKLTMKLVRLHGLLDVVG